MTQAKKSKSQLREWIEAIFFALVVVLFIKTFVFEIYMVPSTSMENSIKAGDIVVVNKLKYGPRLPITPLSIPFTFQHLYENSEIKSYSSTIQLPYFRFPGYADISRNDILVFNYPIEYYFPIDHKTPYVKRCVALPGDTLRIINKKVFVNGKPLKENTAIKKLYEVEFSTEISPELFDYFEWYEGGKTSKANTYRLYLSADVLDSLNKRNDLNHVALVSQNKGGLENLFRTDFSSAITKDFYGPQYVPKKGDTLDLTPANLQNWIDVILRYETPNVEIEDSVIFINGRATNHFVFSNNYYFVLGDNRDNSADSRFWGFVPENHIMGTASVVLFSVNNQTNSWRTKIRWNRTLNFLE